jgi:XTP/dITP diphosphohydrolase
MGPLLVATRSSDKAREIRQILGPLLQRDLITLADLALEESPVEDQLEIHTTFRDNAFAKATHFHSLTGYDIIADDSGIAVDILGGEPGVHSKRFSGRMDLTGVALDTANNQLLLQRLDRRPIHERSAHYACAAVLVCSGRSPIAALGSVSGRIAYDPAGTAGFGYDPIFFYPPLSRTFAEIDPATKNMLSHRARAFRALTAVCAHELRG